MRLVSKLTGNWWNHWFETHPDRRRVQSYTTEAGLCTSHLCDIGNLMRRVTREPIDDEGARP